MTMIIGLKVKSDILHDPYFPLHLLEQEEKRIRKAFRQPDGLPKILVVTEKLLTGFDAPILYCMYLDKPMRDHVLLQAIARVNRPHEDDEGRRKLSGFVLDFVGIFDNLEKALAFDSQDIEGVVQDIEILKERFIQLMTDAQRKYLILIDGKTQDKAVEAVLEHFIDEEVRHEYYQFFKDVSGIYDILSPDAFLRPHIEDMETLAKMHRILREAYEPGILLDRDFSRKTAKLVQEHTRSSKIKPALDIYEINKDTLRKIEESGVSDTEKIFNLIKSIDRTITDNASIELYLISIGEKAELIAELYKQRQKSTQEALEELKEIIEEINSARRERTERNMPVEVFSIFWILKNESVDNPEDKASHMRGILEEFPHWKRSESHERRVKQELCKVLIQSEMRDPHRVISIADSVMRVIKGGVG